MRSIFALVLFFSLTITNSSFAIANLLSGFCGGVKKIRLSRESKSHLEETWNNIAGSIDKSIREFDSKEPGPPKESLWVDNIMLDEFQKEFNEIVAATNEDSSHANRFRRLGDPNRNEASYRRLENIQNSQNLYFKQFKERKMLELKQYLESGQRPPSPIKDGEIEALKVESFDPRLHLMSNDSLGSRAKNTFTAEIDSALKSLDIQQKLALLSELAITVSTFGFPQAKFPSISILVANNEFSKFIAEITVYAKTKLVEMNTEDSWYYFGTSYTNLNYLYGSNSTIHNEAFKLLFESPSSLEKIIGLKRALRDTKKLEDYEDFRKVMERYRSENPG